MRSWALPLLRCLSCGHDGLQLRTDDVWCPRCQTAFRRDDDVTDFLFRPHPAVCRERDAVHKIDRDAGVPPDQAREILRRLQAGTLTAEELERSEHTRVIAEARAQLQSLFASDGPTPGSTVLDIGADSGWVSSVLLLQRRCKVIAIDITDHLRLTPDADSTNLCRLLADMNAIPLRDSAVDAVVAASCVHHSWDLGRTFREIHRVLKPGGTAWLLGEPIPSLPRYLVGGNFGAKERTLGINETWIVRSRWLKEARTAGLEPTVVFPALSGDQLKQRLARAGLPRALSAVIRPVLPALQVSVHLRARKA